MLRLCWKHRGMLAAAMLLTLLLSHPTGSFVAYANADVEYLTDEELEAELDGEQTEEEAAAEAEATAKEEEERKAKEDAEYQQKMDDYNSKLDQLQAQRKEIEKDINATQSAKGKQLANQEALEHQISLSQQEIGLLMERYNLLEGNIQGMQAQVETLQEEIEEKERQHGENYQAYLDKLREMQLYDEGSMLGLLLGADSYVDYLSSSEVMNRIAEYERQLIQGIQEERGALEEDQKLLKEEIAGLEQSQQTLNEEKVYIEKKKQTLAQENQLVTEKIQDISRMEQEYLADLENNQRIQADMQAEMERMIRQAQTNDNPYAGGEMAWPVPGYYDISSRYGWRFGGTDFHTGNDITGGGINGAPVVAANDGVVTLVNWEHSPGRGYGIYVMIDHGVNESGNNIGTLYAHLSNIQVSLGQEVKKGETIGNVGSTGWSTGPHLHFEVRINKQHVDSLPYITG